MNPRERTLAIVVGGLLALAGLWAAVQWGVVDRWKALHTEIARAHTDIDRTRRNLELAKGAEADWSALRPVSHNPDRAENAFRQDINQLLEKNGLHEDCTIGRAMQQKLKNEFTEVSLSVQVHGHLQQLVNFMCDFYERDYLARLDQINLTAEEKPASAARSTRGATRGRRGRGASSVARGDPGNDSEGPMLNVSLLASTLVLPQLWIGDTPVPQPTAEEAGEEGDEPVQRLPRPREEYARIWETNIFKLYQEPPAKQVTPVAVKQPESDQETPKDVTQPPPPRPNKYVAAATCTFGSLAVYVRERDDPGSVPEKVEINQPVDDGTLVLVVPDGMVVQVSERHGSTTAMKYYFYPLGKDYSFQDRRELNAREYPEIQAQLDKALSG